MSRKSWFVGSYVLLCALLLANDSTAQSTKYIHDDSGRMTKVIDSNGNILTYFYDANGNLVQVGRATSPAQNALAILNFVPQSGSIGTTVTIQGQNFSSTASANTVTFNGTAAAIVSATSTSLVVTVPTTATTGTIGLTVNAVTATSTDTFTVVASPSVVSVNPKFAVSSSIATTISSFSVTGANLKGATFSFAPAFTPASIVVNSAAIDPSGNSATLNLTVGAGVKGSFTLIATNAAGSSSPISTATLQIVDPDGDADGDGLTNALEIALGTNPLNPQTSGTGLPDGWQLFYKFSPLDPSVASQSFDGSALTVLQDYQQGLSPRNPNLVPPGVTQITPKDGTNSVYVNSVVVVRFGEPLQTGTSLAAAQSSITAALPANALPTASFKIAAQTLQNYMNRTCCGNSVIPGTVTLTSSFGAITGGVTPSSDGLSVTFASSQPLTSNTTYAVQVNGVRDAAGNLMTKAFNSTFTTGSTVDYSIPKVTLVDPENGSTNVPTNAHYIVQFSKPMDPATLSPANFTIVDLTTNAAVPGSVQVNADGLTAAFIPNPSLPIGRTFTVTFSTGIKDTVGNNLASAVSYSFSTGYAEETTRPHLVANSPTTGATGIPVNAIIDLLFSQPLDITSVVPNIQVSVNGQPIAVQIALSNADQRVTITPVAGLQANVTYTVAVGAGIANIAGLLLDNAGTFTFQSAAVVDKSTLTVTTIDPANSLTGVPINVKPRIAFSKPVDVVSVSSSTIALYPASLGTSSPVSATLTPSADGISVTVTPTTSLIPQTRYCLYVVGLSDLVGQTQSGSGQSCFTTSSTTQTTAPVVTGISPANGATGVPVNATVQIALSTPISAASAGSNAITLTTNGQPVAGSISAGTDSASLTFTPSSSLAVSANYTVTVGGFTDLAGNPVTAFTSAFSTSSSSAVDNASPKVLSVTPASGSTNVVVTTPVVVTFNKSINPVTINTGTVSILANNNIVAGTYAVNGAVVTFTPLTPLPGSATIRVYVSYYAALQDFAGNNGTASTATSFTTAATVDTTIPTVVSVTPSNGATGAGLTGQVTVLFSKSMNPATLTTSNVALLAGNVKQSFSLSVSADNRMLILSGMNLPGSTVLTLSISGNVTDLTGNALADFTSQFTTTSAFDTSSAKVSSQRPANGATDVSLNASPVVLFVNKPLNPSTITNALHVSQNGLVIAGTVAVVGNGQALQFTPASPWTYGSLVQVFLDGTALDTSGNPVTLYKGSFTVVGDPTVTTPTVINLSPGSNAANVPLNAIMEASYSQPVTAAGVALTSNVFLNGPSGSVTSTVTLDSTGTIIRLVPTAPLTAKSQYCFYTSNLIGVNGKAAQNQAFCFTSGTASQTTAPTVTNVSPADKLGNVPINTNVSVIFSSPIDPLTVNATTVSISASGSTSMLASISFANGNQTVQVTPEAPLPASTTATITIAGVKDIAGNTVPTFTSTFTTSTAAYTATPGIIAQNPAAGSTGVAVNVALSLQANAALDGTTVNTNTFRVYDGTLNQYLSGTYSLSADGTTVYFLPTTPLGAGRNYTVYFNSYGMTDLAGNLLTASCSGCLNNYNFVTGFAVSTAAPHVTAISPANGLIKVPINAQLAVSFDEPINTGSLGGVTLKAGGSVVAITSTLSTGNQLLTITPVAGLLPSTSYTLTIAGVSDVTGKVMTTPVTSTFTTGTKPDLSPLTVVKIDPANSSVGVPLNARVQVGFSKGVNVVSLNGGNLQVYPYSVGSGLLIKGSLTPSADGTSVTFTPATNFLAQTHYCIYVSGVLDLEGQQQSGYGQVCFTTGSSTQTSGPTVTSVSPVDGTTGAPINSVVQVNLNQPISTVSAGNTSITLTANGQPIAGTVSIPTATSLLFTPSANLAPSTAYTVNAGGFTDLAGNAATAFTSAFTTGSGTTADSAGPSVLSITPPSGSTNVAVTTPIVVAFNKPVNPASINSSTVTVLANNNNIAGSYAINGAVVTFTPLTPLPGGATIRVYVSYYAYVQDFAGNNGPGSTGTNFTTAATSDTTAPTVLVVNPASGAISVGLNGQVTVLFSKSINPATINTSNIALLAGGARQNFSYGLSADNRMLVLSGFTLPGSSVITLALSHGITDLSGNSLADFTSQFTTLSAFDTTSGRVVGQRPGNGATSVSLTASPVVLFVNKPLTSSSVAGALHISQNGQLVAGSVSVLGNGQTIVFTPTSQWQYGALVQVFLDSTALDTSDNAVTAFNGSFTTVGDPATTAPTVLNTTPSSSSTNVPLNAVIGISYSQPLDPAFLLAGNVYLNGPTGTVANSLKLDATGTVIHITPAAALTASAQYCYYSYNQQGVNGKAAQNIGTCFTTGTAAQTTAPTVSLVSPPNNLANVPLNANVSVNFTGPIDPLTVTGTTIAISTGGTTFTPASISFSNANQTVIVTPEAPFPASTTLTLTITGVKDTVGNTVPTFTSTFTTGTTAATANPGIIAENPSANATGVPVNAAISLQANTAIDATSVNLNTFRLYDQTLNQYPNGTYSLSPDATTVFFVPSTQLATGRQYSVYFGNYGMTDLAGNAVAASCAGCLNNYSFTTGFAASTTAPQVTGISPASGLTKVPINAQLTASFNEPVNAETLGGITLKTNGNAVGISMSLGSGNQLLSITPTAGLLTNTTYTLTIAGVADLSGHAMTASVTSSFTTGSGPDLTALTVTGFDPVNGMTGVPVNVKLRVGFSKGVDIVSLGGGNLQVYPYAVGTATLVSGSLAPSSDGTSVTFTPTTSLITNTRYCVYISGIVDLEGQPLSGSSQSCFTTGPNGQTSAPTVTAISPGNATTGVPVNAPIQVGLSTPISGVSVGSTAITITAAGQPVAGTVSLATSSTVLTFTPTTNLAVSSTYNVAVGGFTDLAGNLVTAFTSSFTTASSSTPDKTGPTVLSVIPASGSTAVPVTSNVVVTFNKPVNPLTVNSSTVSILANNNIVAGTYAVNGAVVTFTPLSPLPGGATMRVYVSYYAALQDLAGNNGSGSTGTTFTTAATIDATAPTVLSVTPIGGATSVGLNGQITVLFSKSMNPATLTTSNIALLAGGAKQSFSPSISADNRMLVLTNLNLPPLTVLTLAISGGATDLSGNPLVDFTSQFTTTYAFDTTSAKVVSQRPGNGATAVSLNASPIVLFLNKTLDPTSVPGALHISQNGQLVTGTAAVIGNGQTIQFTPTSPWSYGALVQVFLDTTAVDTSGNAVTSYKGAFTVVSDPATTAPTVLNVSPLNGATAVPLNPVMDIAYSVPVTSATVSVAANVFLNGPSASVPATVTLDASGTIIHITANAALAASTRYCFYSYNLQGVNGKAAQNQGSCFTTGTAAQTTAPTVSLVSPANNLANVPLNANVGVVFTAPIDPLTVTGATIVVSGGGSSSTPASISFSNNNRIVAVTPEAPLPASTAMTITITGIKDLAGNTVPTFTSTFTTGSAAATATPGILIANPSPGSTGLAVNVAITLQANAPIDGSTVNSSTFQVYDNTLNQYVPGTYSLSADSTSVYFVPNTQLATGRAYYIYYAGYGMTDLAGNSLTSCSGCLSNFSFTTGFTVGTAGPQVTGVSPANGLVKIPINVQLTVSFNEPVNGQSLSGITLKTNGTLVPLSYSLSSGNQLLTITPIAGLLASKPYTLAITGVSDVSGNVMSGTVTTTFTTGVGPDLTPLTITAFDPVSGLVGVPINATMRVGFSKGVNVVSLGGGNLVVYPSSVGTATLVGGIIALSSDGTSATFTPTTILLPETRYCAYVNGVVDLEGQPLTGSSQTCFITGTATLTSAPVVTAVSPTSAATGVATNTVVQIGLSAAVSSVSVTNTSITLTAGGQTVPGTVSIGSGSTSLTFTPTTSLAVSTGYTVNVGGFTDLAGNAVTAFTSTFTTGSIATADKTGPTVLNVTPASGATAVAVTTPIVVTFNKPINPLTVNSSSVSILANNNIVAGTYAINGTVVTFTPLSPLPGGATIRVYVSYYASVQDFAANNGGGSTGTTFTTATTADTTAPTVVLVTPSSGSTGVGLNGQVVVSFSKSMNPATLTSGTVFLLAGNAKLSFSLNVSADNRTIVLSNLNLPGSSVITLAVSSGAADLSSNPLADYTSQFVTASAFDTTSGRVVNQRPGNGATGVSINASPVVLFVNKPMNASTIPGALHISQNGQLVTGTVAVVGNGQTIQFTPASPWVFGALVQVFLDTTATDTSGNAVTAYKGSFTVTGDPTTTAPALLNASPLASTTNVPLNVILDAFYSQPLDPTTVIAKNVYVTGPGGTAIAATIALDSAGTTIHVTPASNLSANAQYCFYRYNMVGTNGLAVSNLGYCFKTGGSLQTTAPNVSSVSPANSLGNVPLNANISIVFTGPIDPLTISATTVTISGGGMTSMPASISFTNNNQTVSITPEAPLPPSTTLTLTISGVKDVAANTVPTFTSSFATGTSAATITPLIVVVSPPPAQTGVPINAVVSLQANSPFDATTVSATSFRLYDSTLNQDVIGTYSLSTDATTAYFVPAASLATGRSYSVYFAGDNTGTGMTDLAGNAFNGSTFNFTTGVAASSAAPQVTGISPLGGLTKVPINAQLTVSFNEPINAQRLTGITLATNGNPIVITTSLGSANQLLTITPTAGLLANTTYTLTIAGVADLSGNTMTTPVTSTFTTSAGPELSTPTITAITPANNTTGVLIASAIQVQFSKLMNTLSINSQSVKISTNGTNFIAATITFNATGSLASITPAAPLAPSTVYSIQLTTAINDLEGLPIANFPSSFTTGTN